MRYKDMSPSHGKSGNCYSDLDGEMLGFFLMLKEKERIVNITITFTGHVKMTVHWNPQHTSSYESAGVNSAQIIYTLGVGCRDQEGSWISAWTALMAVRQLLQHYEKVNDSSPHWAGSSGLMMVCMAFLKKLFFFCFTVLDFKYKTRKKTYQSTRLTYKTY